MNKLIELDQVIKEIERFKGYLDEDMICRLGIAMRRLPTAIVTKVTLTKDKLEAVPYVAQVTHEQVKEYCRKRNLAMIDERLLNCLLEKGYDDGSNRHI